MTPKEKNKMIDYLIIVVIVMLCIVILTAIKAEGQTRIGYQVVIDDRGSLDVKSFNTQSLGKVYKAYGYATCMKLDTANMFIDDRVLFEHRNESLTFYVEKKEVVKKKNGKIVYRKIKKQK